MANINQKCISLEILRIFCIYFASSNSRTFWNFSRFNKQIIFISKNGNKKYKFYRNILKIVDHKRQIYISPNYCINRKNGILHKNQNWSKCVIKNVSMNICFRKTRFNVHLWIRIHNGNNKVNKRHKYLHLHLIHLFLTCADCFRKPILYVN